MTTSAATGEVEDAVGGERRHAGAGEGGTMDAMATFHHRSDPLGA